MLRIDCAAVDVADGDGAVYRLVCELGTTAGLWIVEDGVSTGAIAELDDMLGEAAELDGVKMFPGVIEVDGSAVDVGSGICEVAGLVCGLATTDELGTTVSAAATTRLVEGDAEDTTMGNGMLIVLDGNTGTVELSVHGSVDENVKVP